MGSQFSNSSSAKHFSMKNLVLPFCLAALSAAAPAPQSANEVATRIVAVSESKPELLSAAVSQADPDLLRVALTDARPDTLETALTAADPALLTLALTEATSELLGVALKEADIKLLGAALTRGVKPELLATALTRSRPDT